MRKFVSFRTIAPAFIIAMAGACDAGSKSKTPADLAADSALDADLALANRDTALVDSIGRFTAVEGVLADTGKTDSLKAKAMASPLPATGSPLPAASKPLPAASKPSPVAAEQVPVVRKPTPGAGKVVPVTRVIPPRTASGNPCDSPRQADQRACLRLSTAEADKRVNGIYRALIVELRRKGGSSETEVARLRTSQRAWLANRDTECRKRGAGKEGALWAYPRVHCYAQFSDQRAAELGDSFSRLTAH